MPRRSYAPVLVNPHAKPIQKYTRRGKRILSLFQQGYSIAAIARSMEMAHSTVSAIIRNPTSAAILQQAVAETEAEFQALAPLAVDGIRASLNEANEIETRRKASKDYFDIAARRSQIEGAQATGGAEELIERAIEIAQENGATVKIAERRHRIPNRAQEGSEQ